MSAGPGYMSICNGLIKKLLLIAMVPKEVDIRVVTPVLVEQIKRLEDTKGMH